MHAADMNEEESSTRARGAKDGKWEGKGGAVTIKPEKEWEKEGGCSEVVK